MVDIKRSEKPSCFIYFQFMPLTQRFQAFRKKNIIEDKNVGTDSLIGTGTGEKLRVKL